MSHSFSNFVETNIDVKLFFFQSTSLLVVELDEVLYEVKEVSWSDGHNVSATFDNLGVDLVQRLVDVDHGVDNSVSVLGRHGEKSAGYGEVVRGLPCGNIQVHLDGKLSTNLEESVVRPVTKPVEDTSVEQSWRRGCSVLQTI